MQLGYAARSLTVFFGVLAGCGGGPTTKPGTANTCKVAPPETNKTAVVKEMAAKINVKILEYAEVGGGFGQEQRATVDETFQKVSDDNTSCAMLLQTYACLGMAGQADLARELACAINTKCAGAACPNK